LSGGEKRRLQLLRVLMSNPNFLIFDEPTNDLDITTLSILEEYLENYEGCLLIVSHDRYFMDRLVDHLFVMEGEGSIRDFPGNYSDFREKFGTPGTDKNSRREEKAEKKVFVEKDKKTTAVRLSYNEKRELEQLEQQMPKLELEKGEITERMNTETEYEKLQELAQRLEQINEELDEKELRWLELSDKSA
jgi:ATP-binding cassette subfamily F protein uup